jgi:hypothetical protein
VKKQIEAILNIACDEIDRSKEEADNKEHNNGNDMTDEDR